VEDGRDVVGRLLVDHQSLGSPSVPDPIDRTSAVMPATRRTTAARIRSHLHSKVLAVVPVVSVVSVVSVPGVAFNVPEVWSVSDGQLRASVNQRSEMLLNRFSWSSGSP
jgi:hypothetical protein